MKKILRGILLVLVILAAFLIQNNLGRFVPFFTVTPNLLLVVTFAIGFLKGRNLGMFTGLCSGLLLDAFSGGILGANVLVFIYIGYMSGILSRTLVNDMIVLPLILCLIAESVYSLYSYVIHVLLIGKMNFGSYLTSIAIPELLLTLLCTVLVYGIIMSVCRAMDQKDKEKESRFAE